MDASKRIISLTPDHPDSAHLLVELQTAPPASSYVHYTGSSMYPTLKEPEFLIIETIDTHHLRPGDIIVFNSSHRKIPIIHRIIRIRDGRFITRGDNSSGPDPDPVNPDCIIGRAYGVLTHTGIRRIRNGRTGMLKCQVYRIWKTMKLQFLKPLLINGYTRHIAELVTRLIFISPEMALFLSADKKAQIHLIWKRRTVAIHDIQSGRTFIRQRYRLMLNRRSLEKRIVTTIGSSRCFTALNGAPGEGSRLS